MFTILKALPLLWQLAIGAAVVLAIGTAYLSWHHHVFQQGYASAIADVAANDEAAKSRVRAGEADVNACRGAGKTWDVVTGKCL